jgi:hypothetical protein
VRLLLAAQTPTLAPEAYSTIRQAEHIAQTGIPYRVDTLSIDTLPQTPLPLFPYILAFNTILVGSYAYVLVPNALATLLHAAIFILAFNLTQRRDYAFAAMIASIMIPSYLHATLLTVSSVSLAIPLLVITLALFIKLRKSKEKRWQLLFVTGALLATHPLGLITIPVFFCSCIFAVINRARELAIQVEFAIFTTFFAAWAYGLVYKEQFLHHGLATIHGNLPASLYHEVYGMPSIANIGIAVGVIPFALALYATYKEGTAQHSSVQTVLALGVVAFFMMLIHAIPTEIGTICIAIACATLVAVGLERLGAYLQTMRGTALPRIIITAGIAVFILTSMVPTVLRGLQSTTETIPHELVEQAHLLRENSVPDNVILAPPPWGAAIAYMSERPVLLDDNYANDRESEQMHLDVTQALTTEDPETVQRIIVTKRVEYIVSERPLSIRDRECLATLEEGRISVQKVIC